MRAISDNLVIEKGEGTKFLLKENFVSEATREEIEKLKNNWKNQKAQIEAELKEMKQLLEIKPNVVNSPMMNYLYAKSGVIFPTEDMIEIKKGQAAKLTRRIEEIKLPSEEQEEKPIEVKEEVEKADAQKDNKDEEQTKLNDFKEEEK